MPKISGQSTQATQAAGACGPNDKTSPPTPGIVRTMAFDRAKEGSSVRSDNSGGGRAPAGRDPAYIELNNVEIGTHIELINLSADPGAQFNEKTTIKLELTGRDAKARTGSVYLKQTDLDKLGLKAGDMYKLRAVDNAGNASEAVTGELMPNEWANGQVIEDGNWANVRGMQFAALDGEGERKNLVAKAVNDGRPPMVKDTAISIATKGNGQKEMVFDGAIEPQAFVRVLNSRTGEAVEGSVDNDSKLTLALKGVEDGDPLVVSVTDNNGTVGRDVEVVYSKSCKDGKAPTLKGGLSTRLPGVI